jgi:hypothetical protein
MSGADGMISGSTRRPALPPIDYDETGVNLW